MRIVTITDTDTKAEVLAFDLIDILRLLDPDQLARSEWTISGVEASGEAAAELHRLDDSGKRVSGPDLLALAARTNQVIDGQLCGRTTQDEEWITIQAIDSSAYDVLSTDDSVIDRIKERFKNVREIPAHQYFGRQN